jgi:hypothetical protein
LSNKKSIKSQNNINSFKSSNKEQQIKSESDAHVLYGKSRDVKLGPFNLKKKKPEFIKDQFATQLSLV